MATPTLGKSTPPGFDEARPFASLFPGIAPMATTPPAATVPVIDDMEGLSDQEWSASEPMRIREAYGYVYDSGTHVGNRKGKINNASFERFDPKARRVTLHVKDSNVPSFWVTLTFTLDDLEAFCAAQRHATMDADSSGDDYFDMPMNAASAEESL